MHHGQEASADLFTAYKQIETVLEARSKATPAARELAVLETRAGKVAKALRLLLATRILAASRAQSQIHNPL